MYVPGDYNILLISVIHSVIQKKGTGPVTRLFSGCQIC